MTDQVGAVFRTILELLRTLSVWVGLHAAPQLPSLATLGAPLPMSCCHTRPSAARMSRPEPCRLPPVQVINLATFYALDGSGDRRFGEPWTSASWLQGG